MPDARHPDFYYQRVAPGIETTAWYEESGAIVHITWYLETQTTHRSGLFPRGSPNDFSVYRGDNQDPHSSRRFGTLHQQRQTGPGRWDDGRLLRVI